MNVIIRIEVVNLRKTLLVLMVLMKVLFLVSCNQEREELLDEEDDIVLVEQTKTLNYLDLWEVRNVDETKGLKLNDLGIVLDDKDNLVRYESNEIPISEFSELVLSWNVKNLNDSQLVFFISVGNENGFSKFHAMGSFKEDQNRSISAEADEYASVNIDTLINKDEKNNLFKLRVNITPNSNENLILENITVTTKPLNNNLVYDESLLINHLIDVDPLQQLSIPNIGNLICSPTSVTMVLNYYGYNFKQEEMAQKVYDYGRRIYGNWTFNASYAGSLESIYSRVEFIDDFNKVVNYIKNDVPVIFSITTTSLNDLEGSIMAFPAGHLIVLIGFEQINGVWYGIFNDPAEYEDNKVMRKYKMEQVLNIWKQYTYIISDEDIF